MCQWHIHVEIDLLRQDPQLRAGFTGLNKMFWWHMVENKLILAPSWRPTKHSSFLFIGIAFEISNMPNNACKPKRC